MALKVAGGVALLAYAHCAASELLQEKAKQREQGELLLPVEPVVKALELLKNTDALKNVYAGEHYSELHALHGLRKEIIELAKPVN